MSSYIVAGRGAGGASEAVGCLWNPHGSQVLRVWWVSFVHSSTPVGLTGWALQRATTRGTPASTITPDLDNHNGRRAGPSSGALLDLGNYTTNATLDASVLARAPMGAVAAGGHDWLFIDKPIVVPGGTGLALNQVTANTLSNVDIVFGWEEG